MPRIKFSSLYRGNAGDFSNFCLLLFLNFWFRRFLTYEYIKLVDLWNFIITYGNAKIKCLYYRKYIFPSLLEYMENCKLDLNEIIVLSEYKLEGRIIQAFIKQNKFFLLIPFKELNQNLKLNTFCWINDVQIRA